MSKREALCAMLRHAGLGYLLIPEPSPALLEVGCRPSLPCCNRHHYTGGGPDGEPIVAGSRRGKRQGWRREGVSAAGREAAAPCSGSRRWRCWTRSSLIAAAHIGRLCGCVTGRTTRLMHHAPVHLLCDLGLGSGLVRLGLAYFSCSELFIEMFTVRVHALFKVFLPAPIFACAGASCVCFLTIKRSAPQHTPQRPGRGHISSRASQKNSEKERPVRAVGQPQAT
jgi:hypothetical protein